MINTIFYCIYITLNYPETKYKADNTLEVVTSCKCNTKGNNRVVVRVRITAVYRTKGSSVEIIARLI